MLYSKSDYYQLSSEKLMVQTIEKNQGKLNNMGALCINTGKFTGRSPEDRFIVLDELTKNSINWNEFNHSIDTNYFKILKEKLLKYFSTLDNAWVRDSFVCSDDTYKLKIRVVNEDPASNLFCYNMFLRPSEDNLKNFNPDWLIIHAPNFKANPLTDGVRSENFAIISFTEKTILIGGTGYTGEMKKGIFTVLNFILPEEKNVLSMHCSANVGKNDDISLFFGLSGTGKTTLSTDPNRTLIGDDEIGWARDSIFNFEGGCYAKVINLDPLKEPEIYNAIKPGAIVENVVFKKNSTEIDFNDISITQNTRVSYPLHFIENSTDKPIFGNPTNIFFLTCDSYGILPPISLLTNEQAMYQFISGYTAKIAGTEEGIKTPKETFSICFGAPFMPLNPNKYALLLGEKIAHHKVHVWLINTGWTGGAFGVGKRMNLIYTRAMIKEALNGNLLKVPFENMPIFNLKIPTLCNNVPTQILNPRNTWKDADLYDKETIQLALKFILNFKKFEKNVDEKIKNAGPKIS